MAIPRPPRPSFAAAVALVLAATLVLACSSDRDVRPGVLRDLVVLAGGNGPARLVSYDAEGATRRLPLPDDATTWLATSTRGDAAATLDDGKLLTATRIGATKPGAWAAEKPTRPDSQPLDGPLLFPTWSPAGDRLAAVVGDTPGGPALVVHAPATDGTLLLPLEAPPQPAPPVWLDDDRIGVVVGLSGRGPALFVIDTRTGETSPGPDVPGSALDVSAEGGQLAIASADRGSLVVLSLDRWLAGSTEGATAIDTGGTVNQLAFDRRGERLAVVVERGDGSGARIRVYARGDDGRWSEATTIPIPGGAPRAEVDWLG